MDLSLFSRFVFRVVFFSEALLISYLVTLCFVISSQVYGAGHMVPMDQPKASLEMLKSWMGGKLTSQRDN